VQRVIEAILFDLGGTLIHFEGAWPDLMQTANLELLNNLEQQGLVLEANVFLNKFRQRLEEYYVQRESEFIEYTTAQILQNLLIEMGHTEATLETLRPALKRLYAVSQAQWKAETDTLSTVESLKQSGIRMGIVSNASDDDDVQTLVDNAGIRTYFDFVLSSAACGIRKPNPRIFQIALDHWKMSPERAAMVGDTLGADILGANNAGIYSVWITRRADTPGNRDHEDTIQPNATIASLAELPELITRINSKQSQPAK
jgi:2-haloalkanoic acid dehalogenase type II